MRNLIIFLFALVFCSQSFAQNNNNPKDDKTLSAPPKIVSSINPIYQIAKFISGDEKNNHLLIASNVSEYDYFMKPSDIRKLNDADVIFYVSDNLELTIANSLSQITNPHIVQLIEASNIQKISNQSRLGQNANDGNIWLSPQNAIEIATTIADALSALYPEGEKLYRKNLRQFTNEVLTMDNNIQSDLADIEEKSFVVDLDRLAYFEQHYKIPALTVIRSRYDDEPSISYIESINKIIKAEKPVCVLGTDKQKSSLAWQVANNHRLKFTLVDVIGNSSKYSENGYVEIMSGVAKNIVKCASKTKK